MIEVHSAPNNRLVALETDIRRIRPSKFNPRKNFDSVALEELAASIKEHGLLEPLVVRAVDGGNVLEGPFEIVAGERRYRACQMAGLSEIPVRVHPGMADDVALRLALVENLQRVDLDPVEEAEGYRALASLGMKQREIAEAVKRSQPAVANAMRILDLPEDVVERIRKGELTASHGIILASYKELPNIQSRLGELAAENKWSTKELEKPWSYSLPDRLKNVTRKLDYNTRFKPEPCKSACPHNAYRKGQYSDDYCLKPSCYDHKQAEVEAERQREIDELVAKAKAAGGAVPNLSSMPYDKRKEFRYGPKPFPKCLAGCESFTVAVDGSQQVQVCTKPSCFNRLYKAAERERTAARREIGERLVQRVVEKLDGLSGIGAKETALIALVGFRSLDAPPVRSAVSRHCPRLGKIDWSNWQAKNTPKELDDSEILPLLKATLEALLRNEIRLRYDLGYGAASEGSGTPLTDWYLGAARPESPAI